jgi:hypothetical protein
LHERDLKALREAVDVRLTRIHIERKLSGSAAAQQLKDERLARNAREREIQQMLLSTRVLSARSRGPVREATLMLPGLLARGGHAATVRLRVEHADRFNPDISAADTLDRWRLEWCDAPAKASSSAASSSVPAAGTDLRRRVLLLNLGHESNGDGNYEQKCDQELVCVATLMLHLGVIEDALQWEALIAQRHPIQGHEAALACCFLVYALFQAIEVNYSYCTPLHLHSELLTDSQWMHAEPESQSYSTDDPLQPWWDDWNESRASPNEMHEGTD